MSEENPKNALESGSASIQKGQYKVQSLLDPRILEAKSSVSPSISPVASNNTFESETGRALKTHHLPRRKPPTSMLELDGTSVDSKMVSDPKNVGRMALSDLDDNIREIELLLEQGMRDISSTSSTNEFKFESDFQHGQEDELLSVKSHLDPLVSRISGETEYYSNEDAQDSTSSRDQDEQSEKSDSEMDITNTTVIHYPTEGASASKPLKSSYSIDSYPSQESSDIAGTSATTSVISSENYSASTNRGSDSFDWNNGSNNTGNSNSKHNSSISINNPLYRSKESHSVSSMNSLRNRSSLTTANTFFRPSGVSIARSTSKQDSLSELSGSKGDLSPIRNTRPELTSHKKSGSISSLLSTYSQHHINLAVLKKNMVLHPGEGEISNYVYTLRKSYGTAYNESLPGKWKLPIGIRPYNPSTFSFNNKFNRHSGTNLQGRAKKSSGVELKHGHLEPRLLATEVGDPNEMYQLDLKPQRTDTSLSATLNPNIQGSITELRSADTSATMFNSSLSKTESYDRSLDGQSEKIDITSNVSSKRMNSIASSSSGSVSDLNYGYYQHEAYLNPDDYDDDHTIENDPDYSPLKVTNSIGSNEDYDKPRLVLANPDDI